mmetsp:Transcript_16897/g.36840  ORF Transcript_16897/g.36840 Transcript_16897/m.36840 type:complete len:126 (+) Transcript_16897:314-691(+)|eukprot:CAMPEP_0168740334 /NCGR_PEP_ID=MMETSP0724-20121128/11928_1 /TAXON_ID=265536 /ORGANISM="Amphiprora sp., Strain CCMP467" /LENGTH=125 /DNA_ID=CAMNT_0008787771 /DNA_START=263 /DNA_END=640 /DNA_ORIENTATION=+
MMQKMDTAGVLPRTGSRSIAIRPTKLSMKRAAPTATGSPTFEDYDSEDSTSSQNYDMMTWRMYSRITSARQRNPLSTRYHQEVADSQPPVPLQAATTIRRQDESASKRVGFEESHESEDIFDFEL